MTRHFQREIDRLKTKILHLSEVIEANVQLAVASIELRDAALAERVIAEDARIDEMEVEVEEDCLKILALHQPVAIDLRFIVAVLKINNDLERIGDLAANIAERAIFLASGKPIEIPFDFSGMAHKAQSMFRASLEAIVNLDTRLARQICVDDNEVDAIHRKVYQQVEAAMRQNPDQLDRLIALLTIARHLERIADHATNIAEDVLYLVEGEISRHKEGTRACLT